MQTTKLQSIVTAASDLNLCQRYGVASCIVGDVYDVDLDDKPISESDRSKWMVTAPADTFPSSLIQAIPLSESEAESLALAVEYLMLRHREVFLSEKPQRSGHQTGDDMLAIPTPTYLAFIHDKSFWPSDKDNLIHGVDVVVEVDGRQWEQPELEPSTFAGTKQVKIIEGMVFENWTPLHSLFDHFASWISGHRPLQQASGEGT